MSGLLIFHPTVAPYRIDFFNALHDAFHTRICLRYWNLRDQTFDYDKLYARFRFRPFYLKEIFRQGGRSFSVGYWKHLDEFRPDVVLTEEFSLGTLMVLLHRFFKRRRYRVISLCDDSYPMVAEGEEFSRWHRWARKWLAPKVDDIVVVEPRVKAWYKAHYGKGFCFPIIQDGESVRRCYAEVLDGSSELRRKHHTADKNVFLFVGRLVALKNVDTIFRAFARMNQREHMLVIVGDGPEKDNLVRLADDLRLNVLFTGRLEGDALYAWYVLADVFVLASVQEAFGAVTNEALLAGCKVLVSCKAGSSCLVQEGVNGFTFEPGDVDDLARLMQVVSAKKGNRESAFLTSGGVCLKRDRMLVSFRECMDRLVLFLNGKYE